MFDPVAEIDALRGSWPFLKEGKTGWWVRLLQRALRVHGVNTEVNGLYGPGVTFAVKNFQREKGLRTDGVVGPQTWNALSIDPRVDIAPIAPPHPEVEFKRSISPMAVRYRITAIAAGLEALKVRENGNNRGEVVDALNKHAAGRTGIPWCVAFCDFCVDNAYESTGLEKPYDVGVSSSALYRAAADAGLLRVSTSARRGDLFIVPGGPTRWKHTGIIERWDGREIVTIEGNTSPAGVSEGQGIYRRRRDPLKEGLAIVSVTD